LTKRTEEIIQLEPDEILDFCGENDNTIREIESKVSARIILRGTEIKIIGEPEGVSEARQLIDDLLYVHRQRGKHSLSDREIKSTLTAFTGAHRHTMRESLLEGIQVPLRRRVITPLTPGQHRYIKTIAQHDIVFGIGPAGTGKTYLAMAMAVSNLAQERIRRIILVRPAVEAGERLGFLPGDIAQKFDPYVRPLWDALYEMLEPEKIQRYIETGIIEIAPLAFMRGRTLNHAFVILDEAQNTTTEQMKMLLTRLGFEAKAVITGDITQIDLPPNTLSGLVHVESILKGIEGIGFTRFDDRDVVRHELVQKIIRAYEQNHHANNNGNNRMNGNGLNDGNRDSQQDQ
jgi:phosphate starvation-inducible PhoH-like protein